MIHGSTLRYRQMRYICVSVRRRLIEGEKQDAVWREQGVRGLMSVLDDYRDRVGSWVHSCGMKHCAFSGPFEQSNSCRIQHEA